MQLLIDGKIVAYSVSGKGPTILMLHGWADTHVTFKPLVADLSKTYSVVCVDLPGFGGSEPPAEAWGLPEYATLVQHFLSKIKLSDEPLHAVVGHSNGGAIAIYASAHQLVAAKKLVLLASAGVRNTQKGKKQLLKLVAKTGKVASVVLPERHRQKLRSKLYAAAGSDLLIAPHMQETFKRIVGYDVQDDARRLVLPVLLVYGSEDEATPVAYGQMLAGAIKGSQLMVIEGAGHFLHQTHSAEVLKEIKAFL